MDARTQHLRTKIVTYATHAFLIALFSRKYTHLLVSEGWTQDWSGLHNPPLGKIE